MRGGKLKVLAANVAVQICLSPFESRKSIENRIAYLKVGW